MHPTTLSRGARRTALAGAFLLVPSTTARWGDVGHRMVGQVAAEILPPDAPAFLRTAGDQLGWLNPEPDRWRESRERRIDPAFDGAHAPEHFLDLELIPVDRRASFFRAPHRFAFADSLRSIGQDIATVGLVNYRILEEVQHLRTQFRRWRAERDTVARRWIEQMIVSDAGILGHYVADVANPAHTTVHYNGWTGPNPNGYATDNQFHARFETAFVAAQVRIGDVREHAKAAPRVIVDIRGAVNQYIAASNTEVERLYTLDKERRFDATNDSPAHRAYAASRLGLATTMLRDLWWTAWVTSATP